MHIYLFEPRTERHAGLIRELKGARLTPVVVEAEFFRRDLSLLNRPGSDERPFLLAGAEAPLDQLRALREAGCTNPVVVLRDFRNSAGAAEALNAGADDDLVIPLKGVELRSRILSIHRRAHGHAAESVTVGEITAFFDGRDPEIAGRRVHLSRREHAIFQHLVLNAGRVVSKAAIYDAVYGMADDRPFDKVIDVYICKIRKKIDAAAPSGHAYIETVYGRGYKFSDEDFGTTGAMPERREPGVAAQPSVALPA